MTLPDRLAILQQNTFNYKKIKKRFILLVTLLVTVISINAQNTSKNCYRGYIDAGYSFGVGDYEFGRFEINTSHGYQFNPYFFLGAGTGLHFMSSYETIVDIRESKVDVPIFANIRCNFSQKKVSPFVDAKGGLFVTNSGGLYANASVGCRFSLNEKQAVSIAIGYALEELEFERPKSSVNRNYIQSATKRKTESITLKLGFEF